MDHVRWLAQLDEASLTNPIVVVAFTGWNDAGDAASTALRTLIETSGASALAEIDPEPFTDFATVRPHVRLDEERNRTIVWPTVGVWSASLPGSDVVLVLGPEPALRWRSFCEQITGIADRVGAPMAFTLGALLADVPHTRPTQIIGTATDSSLIERFDLERSRYEGPTGIVGVLHDAFARSGLPTASLWAAVPGYAAQLPSPRAAIALIERLCSMMGTPPPVSTLATQVADYDAKVGALISDDDDLVTYVERLEEMVDEMSNDDVPGVDDTDPEGLADEVEQFLRDHGDG
ncbi:MAG: PAC2 family protein [Ilumatobacter sp.]|uniref:PAC2 family protein n=1 Tax=Ilumatobacter sp. TaxID=1967498 RepID=UPI00262A55AC|nr:PAC2 family protein [Ilumatobacter sp.]MDJ0768680.1 PAC2 family protein [Ilumatobacter sp.]